MPASSLARLACHALRRWVGQLSRTLPRVDDGSGDSRTVGRACRAAGHPGLGKL